MNVASYDNYMLINSYLTFCFLLFSMTTLLQLGVDSYILSFFRLVVVSIMHTLLLRGFG